MNNATMKQDFYDSEPKRREEERKHWIRTFASNIIAKDTVTNSVKLAVKLWDALEEELSKTNTLH